MLWSLQDLRAPVHTFQPGSAATTDTVLEFGWTAPQVCQHTPWAWAESLLSLLSLLPVKVNLQ